MAVLTVVVCNRGNPWANDWFVVNQLAVQGSKFNRRPDVVVYVNGLCC